MRFWLDAVSDKEIQELLSPASLITDSEKGKTQILLFLARIFTIAVL